MIERGSVTERPFEDDEAQYPGVHRFLLVCGGCTRFDVEHMSALMLADPAINDGEHGWITVAGWQPSPVRCPDCIRDGRDQG